MGALRDVVLNNSSTENSDYLALYLLLRIALAYVLGINPLAVLPGKGPKGKYGLSSGLLSNLPSEI